MKTILMGLGLIVAGVGATSCSTMLDVALPDKVTFGHNLENDSEAVGLHWDLPGLEDLE